MLSAIFLKEFQINCGIVNKKPATPININIIRITNNTISNGTATAPPPAPAAAAPAEPPAVVPAAAVVPPPAAVACAASPAPESC